MKSILITIIALLSISFSFSQDKAAALVKTLSYKDHEARNYQNIIKHCKDCSTNMNKQKNGYVDWELHDKTGIPGSLKYSYKFFSNKPYPQSLLVMGTNTHIKAQFEDMKKYVESKSLKVVKDESSDTRFQEYYNITTSAGRKYSLRLTKRKMDGEDYYNFMFKVIQ